MKTLMIDLKWISARLALACGLCNLRTTDQSVALGHRGKMVLPARFAAAIWFLLLGERLFAPWQRDRFVDDEHSHCRPDGRLSIGLAIPAGYALARLKLPLRGLILLILLIPQAFPNLPVYVNIAASSISSG